MTTTPSFLFLLTVLALVTATISAIAPHTSTRTRARAHAHAHTYYHHCHKRNKLIDALIGSGDFGNWVGILSNTDPSTVHLSATLFIPKNNNAVSSTAAAVNLSLFPYHIVPQRLTFSNLLLFKTHDRIPTLLPNNTILVTNSSRSNFTLNDSPLTYPDLYTTSGIVVHGIGKFLDYSVYGRNLPAPVPKPAAPQHGASVDGAPGKELMGSVEIINRPRLGPGPVTAMRSKGASLSSNFGIFLWVIRGVLALWIWGILFP